MSVKAIDVSYCQQNVDYKAVKASGIQAVIARNGYLNKTDTEFNAHIKNALAAGLDVGTYTYLMSEKPEDAAKEASQTVKRLEAFKGKITYPVFADMESEKYQTSRFDKQSRTDILLAFLKVIDKAGYYPAVYINPAWLEAYIDKTKIIGKYDIWLAAWTENPNKATKFKYGQVMWQWGLDKVNGIKGQVDGDLVFIDYPKKVKNAGKNFLPRLQPVELAYEANVRSAPSINGNIVKLLKPGAKCIVKVGTDTKDPVSGYVYVQLAGGDSQWIVKSAIKL